MNNQVFQKVYFEISGFCQAHCPHCCTGNRSLKEHPSRFIPVKEFESAVELLYKGELVDSSSRFDLYNWGEPFLHPNFIEILQILGNYQARYRLSTNAAKYIKLPSVLTGNLTRLTITIPGFSQTSYDRVHGLNFDLILKNIQQFANNLGPNKIWITYLIHQFNLDEIREAYRYFQKLGIRLAVTVAYMNDYNLSRNYLVGSVSSDQLKKMGKELFLFYVENLIYSRPKDFICPQFSILALDEFCNVLTCCAVPKGHPDYSLGSLFSLTADEIRQGKPKRDVCHECGRLGIDYWIQTPPRFDFLGYLTGEGIPAADLFEMIEWKIIAKFNMLRQLIKNRIYSQRG
jgi:MoaA/NifB/PqqE/SkfB family radical SAM enzyme